MRILDKVRDALAGWLAHSTKANPVGPLLKDNADTDGAQPHAQETDAHNLAYLVNPWVNTASTVIAKNLSSSPLVVETLDYVDGGEEEWVADDKSELARLFARPNSEHPFSFIEWRLTLSLLNTGNGYLNHNKPNAELWWLNPTNSKVKIGDDGKVTGYVFARNGKSTDFKPHEVIHFQLPNPSGEAQPGNEHYGASPIKPLEQAILLDHYNIRNLSGYFRDGAIPDGLLKTDQSISDDDVRITRKRWNAIHRGPDKRDRVAVIGKGVEYQTVTPPLKDQIVSDLFKITREQILAGYGLPPILAGLFEYANYANSEQQLRIFWQNTVIPLQRIIEGIINVQLVPLYDATGRTRVRHDLSQIEALQDDQLIQAQRSTTLYRGGIVTLNEARQIIHMDNLEEGGDEFYTAPTPFGFGDDTEDDDQSDEDQSNNDQEDDQTEDGEKEARRVLSPSTNCASSPTLVKDYKAAHEKKLDRLEKSMLTVLRRYFNGQRDRIISAVMKETDNGKNRSVLGRLLRKDPNDPLDSDDVLAIFDLDTENVELARQVGPFIRKTVRDGGRDAVAAFNLDSMFDVDNPSVYNVIQKFENRIKRINNETWKILRNILKDGYAERESIDEIAKRIRSEYATYFNKTKATRIARTELNGYVNSGATLAYEQNDADGKQWITAGVGVRDQHAIADGEVARLNQPFVRTGEQLQYPGDPNGSAGNVINCRCTTVPVIDPEL